MFQGISSEIYMARNIFKNIEKGWMYLLYGINYKLFNDIKGHFNYTETYIY